MDSVENLQQHRIIEKDEYSKNIPNCCQFQTYEEHKDILWFCWGLISRLNKNKDPSEGCEYCEFYKKN